MKKVTEDYLQNQCWVWFQKNHNNDGLFVAIPNDESNPVQSKRKRLTGRMRGAADILIILDKGRQLFIEMKLPKGVQSDAQKIFEKRVTELGHVYLICRSLEQFKHAIQNHTNKL